MQKRRPQERYWHVSLWIDREQEATIRDLAKSEGLTINGLIKNLLAHAIEAKKRDH